MEHKLDFEKIAGDIGILNTKEQTTLMYRIIQHLGIGVARTTVKYCKNRIRHLEVVEEAPTFHRNKHLIAAEEKD